MWFGLHLNVELILVCASGDRPLQRWEGSHGDATGTQRTQERTLARGNHRGYPLRNKPRIVPLIYLQMLETSGLDQIWGITKKGSAAGLAFMSWSQDTK